MKKLLLICVLMMSAGCVNYHIYTGDKGWVHREDEKGVWHPEQLHKSTTAAPECESPIRDMDKCLDALKLRQH